MPADDDTCRSDLERCRAEGWKLLARSINAPAAAAPRVDAGAAPAAATTQATPPRQKAMLCDISQAYLRAFWESQKDPITRTVLADFADPRKQAVEARKTADRMASTLGLTPAQADGLATDYDRIHAGHISRAVAGLSRDSARLRDSRSAR